MSKPLPPLAASDELTVRERIHHVLRSGPATARDLSQLVSIREREVTDHLAHLERSLKHRGERLVIEAPSCLECGFSFTQRHRFTRPGSCPRCRGRRISFPQFHIELSGSMP